MKELIESIAHKHQENGIEIHSPATLADICSFEQQMGFACQQTSKSSIQYVMASVVMKTFLI